LVLLSCSSICSIKRKRRGREAIIRKRRVRGRAEGNKKEEERVKTRKRRGGEAPATLARHAAPPTTRRASPHLPPAFQVSGFGARVSSSGFFRFFFRFGVWGESCKVWGCQV
jgi:hypothetical protein